jgi:hypothetical protein
VIARAGSARFTAVGRAGECHETFHCGAGLLGDLGRRRWVLAEEDADLGVPDHEPVQEGEGVTGIDDVEMTPPSAAGNVPLNNNLAEYGELTVELAATARTDFEADWNRLNLARTLTITASFISLAVAGTANSRQRPADPGLAGS